MRDISGIVWLRRLGLVAVVLLFPAVAMAQSAFSGLVRDTSGAVLPGVTVEASSPVLIEKVRTAVSDSEGRYSVADLRPGVYTLTFTLTGFNSLRREGVELPTNFTMTINADLPVGALEESRSLWAADPLQGAKPIVRAHASPEGDVEVDDEGAFTDIDTPEEYARALEAIRS